MGRLSRFYLVCACSVSFVAGAAALPVAWTWASGALSPAAIHSSTGATARAPMISRGHGLSLSRRQSLRSADSTGGMGPSWLYGTTPATIVNIYDMPCFYNVTTSADEAKQVAMVDPRTDPRFKRCSATVNGFKIEWSSLPTAAQSRALGQVLGDLAIHRPTISLEDARPIILAAVRAAS